MVKVKINNSEYLELILEPQIKMKHHIIENTDVDEYWLISDNKHFYEAKALEYFGNITTNEPSFFNLSISLWAENRYQVFLAIEQILQRHKEDIARMSLNKILFEIAQFTDYNETIHIAKVIFYPNKQMSTFNRLINYLIGY